MLNKILDMYDKKIPQTGFMKHYFTLFSIVEGLETKNSFEFGTGISTDVIMEALKYTGGKHTSCDIRTIDRTGISQETINNPNYTFVKVNQDASYDWKIKPLDFVLHDGSHIPEEVRKDISLIVPKMKMNGIILVHDTDNINYKNKLYLSTIESLKIIKHEIITLPYSYGLTIIKILEDFGNGEVKTNWKKIK